MSKIIRIIPVISRKSINTQNCITNNHIKNKMLRDMNGLQQLKIQTMNESEKMAYNPVVTNYQTHFFG